MINFIRFNYLYFLISALLLIPGLYSLVNFGLKPAIDFTGGSLLELRLVNQEVTESQIAEVINETLEDPTIQKTNQGIIIRSKPISQETSTAIQQQLQDDFGEVSEVRFETIGPTLGKELLQKTYVAIALAAVAIVLYVGYQFKSISFGVCALIAMLHDTLIVTGAFSLLGYFWGVEVDTLFVTAILTVLSFSIHDTIVVYDRIRESKIRHPKAAFETIANTSIAETLSRSINNSMTIIFMLTALFLMGGETIKWFILALLLGTITGTYSSTFTAVPLLVEWHRLATKSNHS